MEFGYGRRSFDAVLVGSGPGSYSGTRVGIAAAQGAALVAGPRRKDGHEESG